MLWLLRLLFNWPPSHPPQLRPLWFTTWALIVLTLGAAIAGLFDALFMGNAGKSVIAALVGAALLFGLHRFFGAYLADAALYLDPTPAGYRLREDVLKQGVELIKGLSESGEYNRIVVVGHSLGSVMAYEVLRLLWEQKFCGVFASPYPLQSALDELEAEAAAMYTTPSKIDIENFQDKQAG